MTHVVKTLAKGQVVIPKAIRDTLGIAPGTTLHLRVEGNELILFPLPADPISALRGIARGGSSLTRALLQNRREELAHEETDRPRLVRAARVAAGRTRRG